MDPNNPKVGEVFSSADIDPAEMARLDAVIGPIHDAIARAAGKTPRSLRMQLFLNPMYDAPDKAAALAALNTVAFSGPCQLVVTPGPFGKVYRSRVLHNPTWLDLAVDFEFSMDGTGDTTHYALETITPRGPRKGNLQLHVFAGS